MRRSLFLILSLCVAHAAAGAPPPLTLQEALRLADSGNPELAATALERSAADGRRQQAAARPNPTFGVEVENVAGSGVYSGTQMAETTLQLSQLIELGGKRGLRITTANAARQVSAYEFAARRAELLVEVAQTFVQALAAQQRVRLAEESRALAAEFVTGAQRRVQSGAAPAAEDARARLAAASSEIEVQQARRDLAIFKQRLVGLIGNRASRVDTLRGNLDRTPAESSLATLIAGLSANPAIARAKAETTQRASSLALAKSGAVPDLTLAAGPRFFRDTRDTTLVFGASLPLPLWNRNEGAVREAQAELARSQRLQEAAVNRLTTRLGEAWQNYEAARREIDALNRTVLPAAREAFQLTNEGYAAGRASQLEVIDARRGLTAARVQLVNAQAALHSAVAQMEGLTMGPLVRVTGLTNQDK
jgi:cobalt-zinc-cadmium efflux system outer membrane protein